MTINTDHLLRCIQTLESSLRLYEQAAVHSIEQEVFQHAIVKSYELSQETCLKLIKKAMQTYGYGHQTLDHTPFKQCLRMAAKHGLLTLEEVERWFQYRDNRNNTAHDYGEHFVHETLVLIPQFIADLTQIEKVLRQHFMNNDDVSIT